MKVWTNGCFDVLHRGHLELFKFCKQIAGRDGEFIVGVDTDEKVKLDKGKNRPINNLQDRMEMLNSIVYIDKVIPFDSTEDLRKTIRWYQPDLMVIGSDGFHQYNYDCELGEIEYISTIPINNL